MHVGHEAYVTSWTVTCEAATLPKAVGGTGVPTATGNHPFWLKLVLNAFLGRRSHHPAGSLSYPEGLACQPSRSGVESSLTLKSK